ncbi:MAG: hypothetical protein GY769_22640 [bacterium]|nr:hypothetical protein [bacterium]
MARILVVTQGALANELVRGANIIAGHTTRLETLSLDWDESRETSERKLAAALADRGRGTEAEEEVLILADLPGGTPYNVARKFARGRNVEVLSGVNLPMVVRLCCPGCQERSVGELAAWLQEKGRQSICRADSDGRAEGESDSG